MPTASSRFSAAKRSNRPRCRKATYRPPTAPGSRLSALTQIRTREGDRQNHRQSLTVGTLSLAGTLDGPIKRDKGSYLISARYFFPEAVLAIVDNAVRYGFYDVTGKLTYDIRFRSESIPATTT